MGARGINTILAPNLAKGMNPNEDGASLWVQNLTMKAGDGGWDYRGGFGLLARADSSLTANKFSDQQDMGFTRILGIHSFYTSWGTKQVIALVRNQAWLGDQKDSLTSKFGVVYSLMVYDTLYDTTQEHVLHRHTSDEVGKKNWQKHGHYNTDIETDRQQWIDAGAANLVGVRDPIDKEEAWFTEPLLGSVILGTNKLGAWVYTPAVPAPEARAQANTTTSREVAPTTSEDGLVVPLLQRVSYLVDEGGYNFFTAEEFGRPSAAVVVGSRVAFAVGNTVLWSNPENPASVVTENIDVFEDNIVALGSVLGILYVCTEHRTYLLSPASGFIVAGGDLRLVSAEVGCISPACITRYGGTLAIAHTSGIYVLDGTAHLTPVSGPITPLFDGEGIESPWTQFSQTTMVTIGAVLPQVYYRLNDQSQIGCHLTTDDTGRMLFTLPALGVTFCFEGGAWHVWSYSTLVNNDHKVLSTNNLPEARLTALGKDVFMVSGPTAQLQVDAVDNDWNAPNRSISFLQLGRGGSLDRNSGLNEDRRYDAGEYSQAPIGLQLGLEHRDRGYFYLEPPEIIPVGTVWNWASVTVGPSDLAFFVPVTLVPPKPSITYNVANLTSFYFSFSFDNVNFQPYINDAAPTTYEPVYQLPVERLSAAPAYALGTADEALTKGVYVFNSGTGLPDPAGNEIRVFVDSAFGGGWTGHPEFNFQRRIKNPILKFAFKSKLVSGNLFGFTMSGLTASVTNSTPTVYPTGMYLWDDTTMPVRYGWQETGSNTAQAADWMLHGAEVSSEGQILKTQGVTLRSLTSGQSTANFIGMNYPNGLLNLALSASRKGLSGQTTDITPTPVNTKGYQTVTHDPLVPRLGSPVTNAVFGGAATWGDDGDATKGNFLIADTPVDRLNISGRMSGDAIRLTLYGHIRDKAERIKVYATEVVAHLMGGGPRRRGR